MFVSAGAYARELDLSLYAETITSTILGIAHTFNKGPIGERTLVTNIDRLVETFGEPIDSSDSTSACQGWFAAREYLRNGNKLYVTRVESSASPAADSKMSIQGTTEDTVSTIADGTTSAAGVRTLTSAAGDFAADGVLVGDVVEVHDTVATGDNGFYVITNVAAGVITIDRDWPTGGLGAGALAATVWSAKKEGGSDGVTSASTTRKFYSSLSTFTTNGVAAGDVLKIADSGVTGDNGVYLVSSVDAQGEITLDRDFASGDLPLTEAITLVNELAVDYEAHRVLTAGAVHGAADAVNVITATAPATTLAQAVALANDLRLMYEAHRIYVAAGCHTNPDATNVITAAACTNLRTLVVLVNDLRTQYEAHRVLTAGPVHGAADNTNAVAAPAAGLTFTIYSNISTGVDGATSVDGEFSSAGAKFSDHGVQAGDILYINDTVDTGCNGYYYITGLKVGSTDTTVTVNNAAWTSALINLTYYILPGAIAFTGASEGTWCEGLRLYPKPNASYQNDKFDLEVRDSTGSIILERVYNMDETDVVATMSSDSGYFTAALLSDRNDFLTGNYFTMCGGDDGYTSITDADYIGNSITGTGLRSFLNAEKVDINLLACPGVSTQNVQDELINICEARGDCFALIDPPDYSSIGTVNAILQFTNGLLTRTTALNSSYAGLWWTWQQVYDEYHDDDVWTAPSGHIASVMAFNDNVKAPWYAPAGLKRGKLKGSKDLRYSPDQDDREALQGGTARVNPIVEFTGEGIYVFGQKTLTTVNSALNRVNVRRMMLYVEKVIATAARQLIFEPNDEVLDREFKQLVEPVLDNVLSRRGIREYLIVAASTSTDRDNNKAVYKIFIKPTKSAEVIEIQFALTSQGASFVEMIASAA